MPQQPACSCAIRAPPLGYLPSWAAGHGPFLTGLLQTILQVRVLLHQQVEVPLRLLLRGQPGLPRHAEFLRRRTTQGDELVGVVLPQLLRCHVVRLAQQGCLVGRLLCHLCPLLNQVTWFILPQNGGSSGDPVAPLCCCCCWFCWFCCGAPAHGSPAHGSSPPLLDLSALPSPCRTVLNRRLTDT